MTRRLVVAREPLEERGEDDGADDDPRQRHAEGRERVLREQAAVHREPDQVVPPPVGSQCDAFSIVSFAMPNMGTSATSSTGTL